MSFFYRSDSELEAKLQKEDEVIAEIAEEKKRLADKRKKLHTTYIERKVYWLEQQA